MADEEHVLETAALHRGFRRARLELSSEIVTSRELIRRVTQTLSHANSVLAKIRQNEPIPRLSRIMIVDGDLISGHVLEDALASTGHLAETASTSTSALVLARYFMPDVVLVDIGVDNWDLPRALRAQRYIRMIMVTGCGDLDNRQRSMDAGFDQHLMKSDELARVVTALVA
jgi:CheY-like chemotaxis protein